jgi:lipoprotein-releasing system permease protein
MFKPVSFYIGLRYTRAKRKNHFISFISLISMLGLALGVMVLIIVLSVMNGFDRELKQRILGMVPHATITQAKGPFTRWEEVIGSLIQNPEVEAAAPFINAHGMLTHRGRVQGVMTYGVHPSHEKNVSIVGDHMISGSFDSLQSGEFGIILGELLARKLGVTRGDKVTLVLPEANVNPVGVFPRLKRFTVVGLFAVGAELDASIALIHIGDAARLKRMGAGVEGIRLKMDNLFKAPMLVRELAEGLGGTYYVNDWTRTHGSLFQAIQMEKTMVGLLLTLIVAVAAFNIVSTLVMVVTDKQSDIAILRTMGASSAQIMRIFMVQGSLIGVFGTLSGLVLGVLAALNIPEIVAWIESTLGFSFLSAEVYFISYLPSQLQWKDVLIITVAGLLMSFSATIYPAWRASRTRPAEALRYE